MNFRGNAPLLVTGGSGMLGSEIAAISTRPILAPSRQEMDICDIKSIESYMSSHSFSGVIHCGALARMGLCEADPMSALDTNLLGTGFLVRALMNYERIHKSAVRLVHVSTDGVYPSSRGNYKETDETIPYNSYGWTKLGAECAVNLLKDFCIVRTRFFDPEIIPFDDAATDIFTSSLPLSECAQALLRIFDMEFVGTLNLGAGRESDFEKYRKFKPMLRSTSYENISKDLPFRLGKDASLDCLQWEKLSAKN